MADFKKFRQMNLGMLFAHNNRTEDDGLKHSNENLDLSRTKYNYYFKKGSVNAVNERVSEVFSTGRADQIVLGEMIVTLPKNVLAEDERTFFESVYNFYADDFGEENIINAVVHKDEVTPHMHLDFVPVVKGNISYEVRNRKALESWKATHEGELERLCCKELITRDYLKTMHPRLSKYVENELGYKTDILNGATENGNKTVLKLKSEKLEKEIEEKQKFLDNLAFDIEKLLTLLKQNSLEVEDVELIPLIEKINDLENQNEVFINFISKYGFTFTNEEISALQKMEYKRSKSSNITVFDGSLSQAEIINDAIIVIEIYDKVPRPFPQQDYISQNADLRRMLHTLLIRDGEDKVVFKPSKISDKVYLIIKTDDEKDTINNILTAKDILISNKEEYGKHTIYIDRFENDTYDFIRSALLQTDYKCNYYANRHYDSSGKIQEIEKGF